MTPREQPLYPLEMSLHRVRKAWGGWTGKIGEIWSISGPPRESVILNGPLAGMPLTGAVGRYQQKLLGPGMELDPREPFPMLLKFLATGKSHPIEVHPNDPYTLAKGLPMVGRDKIWHILSVRPGSRICLGFKDRVSHEKILEAVRGRYLHRLMNSISVKSGDVYTIPAGRIHGIGKGVTLFEIQNHSSLGYALFDPDNQKPKKPPQIADFKDAFEFLDLGAFNPEPILPLQIPSGDCRTDYLALTSRYFLRRLKIRGSFEIHFSGRRFVIYTGVRGNGWLRWGLSKIYAKVQPFQSVLVPALEEDLLFETEGELEVIETSVPHMAGGIQEQLIATGIPMDRFTELGGRDYEAILGTLLGEGM
jgi:mannose-6-phosphate isomerase